MSLPNRIRIAGITGGGSSGVGYYDLTIEASLKIYQQEEGTWKFFRDGEEDWVLFDGTDYVEVVVCAGTSDAIPTTPELNAGLKTEDGYGGAVLIRPEPMVPVKLQVSGDTTPDVAGVYPQTIIEPDVFFWTLAEEPYILLIRIYWDFEKGQYVLLYFKDLGDEEFDEFYFLGPDNYYSPLGNYVADGETGAVGTAVVSKFISQGGLSAAAYQYLMDVE